MVPETLTIVRPVMTVSQMRHVAAATAADAPETAADADEAAIAPTEDHRKTTAAAAAAAADHVRW